MIKRKVAMVGASGVGKTSLVRRYISGIFDETYLTTLGVKVDEKVVCVDENEVKLLLWDIAGAEENFSIPLSYIRGASGCLLVMDGTRKSTVELGIQLWEEIREGLGSLPFVVALNKTDLLKEWEVDEALMSKLESRQVPLVHSSAKTGEGVEEGFLELTRCLLKC